MLVVLTLASLGVKFAQIAPLKAAMLTKTWIGLLAEVDQKVGVVPELGDTSVGVKRFGPELERRTLCKRQFERFYESTYGIAIADKSDSPAEKRELVTQLHLAGGKRGPHAKVYASLSSPAVMSLVEQVPEEAEWNVLFLVVNPTERNMDLIVAAERAALAELCVQLPSGGELRVEATTAAALAGDAEALGLSPLGESNTWYRCTL